MDNFFKFVSIALAGYGSFTAFFIKDSKGNIATTTFVINSYVILLISTAFIAILHFWEIRNWDKKYIHIVDIIENSFDCQLRMMNTTCGFFSLLFIIILLLSWRQLAKNGFVKITSPIIKKDIENEKKEEIIMRTAQ